MSDDKTTMSPQQRKQAEAEAARIKRVAEKTTTGGQLGGTYFGQEPDEGMAPAKKSADNDS
ncbi:hypothetical protein [Roseibium marinum]|uniref:Uncharacterized protein n=1 Tax=Roseibium marinum TaxID=281252 RepID=A0A2S3V2G4_9HYPH|nr:hypothetical protein [Roseibium marinum]POF34167.1 hypothetical protein CLV41_101619 [Roseibium marinum]